MKTFDEALAVCCRPNSERNVLLIEDHLRRYESLADDALNSEVLQYVCAQMLRDLHAGTLDAESCIFTTFMLGLQVGVEMEKA